MSIRSFVYIFISCFLTQAVVADIPEGYYSKANGKKSAELKAALHEIIRTASVLNYGKGEGATWGGFYITDRTSDNYCVDRYSSNQRQFTEANKAPDGMNIEHSFAKSWWVGGESMQAYFDLYNLMPSDSEANSKKSNYAMGEVTQVSWTNGSLKIGKGENVSNNIWEPEDKWKGDFARSYMYMVTCYADYTWRSNGLDQLDNNEWPTFNEWTRELVLEWARQDPVDEIELNRNNAIYEIQGNRNPYVDFPNLCEYVWGDSTGYAFTTDDTEIVPEETIVVVDEAMTNGLGIFRDVLPDGAPGSLWKSDSSYGATANAYNSGKVADNYLLAEVNLTSIKDATLEFTHQTGYNAGVEVGDSYFFVLVTDDYNECPMETAWESLDVEYPETPTNGWSQAQSSGSVSLNAYTGRQIVLAFRYTSNSDACYGWEIRNVKITGNPIETGIEDVVDAPSGLVTGKVYDLTGRRINLSNAKGIYLMNGKKYIR